MDFNEYQDLAADTAVHPGGNDGIVYLALGLGGEAGEVQESVKKWQRGQGAMGELDEEHLDGVEHELGDVLWYLARLADELGYDLEDIAEMNREKLVARQDANELHSHE